MFTLKQMQTQEISHSQSTFPYTSEREMMHAHYNLSRFICFARVCACDVHMLNKSKCKHKENFHFSCACIFDVHMFHCLCLHLYLRLHLCYTCEPGFTVQWLQPAGPPTCNTKFHDDQSEQEFRTKYYFSVYHLLCTQLDSDLFFHKEQTLFFLTSSRQKNCLQLGARTQVTSWGVNPMSQNYVTWLWKAIPTYLDHRKSQQ